jgi:excisionase family DNA binding protein
VKHFYKVEEAAERLGISRSGVYRLVKEGTIRSVRISGALRVPAAAIDEFADCINGQA